MDTKVFAAIAELRARGLPPKAIARKLGLRPAEVSALIREQAAQLEVHKDPQALPALKACYVSPGWSVGLGLSGAAEPWRACDLAGYSAAEGLVLVLWVRAHRYDKLSACGCLVDVYCLGVKNTIGPKVLEPDELRPFVARYFQHYSQGPVEVPLELTQNLVFGAVDYARSLGFEPQPDFELVRPSLGEWIGPSPIRFGRDGYPFYSQGPDDNPYHVLQTLRRTVGDGHFGYVAEI